MNKSTAIYERIFNRPRSFGRVILVALITLGIPFLAAILDGDLEPFFRQGVWRTVLFAPTITLYIWIISPPMARAGENVITALRPLILLGDDDFATQRYAAEYINPRYEITAIALGALLGFAAIFAEFNSEFSWIIFYWMFTTILMYAVLAWTIFIAVMSTRFNAALHRFPLQIDILDPGPFESVGRQSLLLALVFIGGITISLIFTYSDERLVQPEFWISNLFFVLFILLIFFLSMRPTHLILAAEKKRRLAPVTSRINATCRELVQQLEEGTDAGQLPAEITALMAFEVRLQSARTWPYNVSILRTLFFSVFIPLISVLARLAVDLLFP